MGNFANVHPEALSWTQNLVTLNLPKSAQTLPLILWIATSPEANRASTCDPHVTSNICVGKFAQNPDKNRQKLKSELFHTEFSPVNPPHRPVVAWWGACSGFTWPGCIRTLLESRGGLGIGSGIATSHPPPPPPPPGGGVLYPPGTLQEKQGSNQ